MFPDLESIITGLDKSKFEFILYALSMPLSCSSEIKSVLLSSSYTQPSD